MGSWECNCASFCDNLTQYCAISNVPMQSFFLIVNVILFKRKIVLRINLYFQVNRCQEHNVSEQFCRWWYVIKQRTAVYWLTLMRVVVLWFHQHTRKNRCESRSVANPVVLELVFRWYQPAHTARCIPQWPGLGPSSPSDSSHPKSRRMGLDIQRRGSFLACVDHN